MSSGPALQQAGGDACRGDGDGLSACGSDSGEQDILKESFSTACEKAKARYSSISDKILLEYTR